MKKNAAKILDADQGKLESILKFVSFLFTKPGFNLIKRVINKNLYKAGILKEKQVEYPKWIKNKLDPVFLKKEFETTYPQLRYKPKFTIIIVTNNPENNYLGAAINSVQEQLYPDWELLLVDNCPGYTGKNKLPLEDKRIKVIDNRQKETHSECYNQARLIAAGDYTLFMMPDSLLTINCLHEVAKYINTNMDCEAIYFDEDKVDDAGNFSKPYFKPAYSPDSLLSRNYIGYSFAVKTKLAYLQAACIDGFDGNGIYDLLLKAVGSDSIGHIPKILFHHRLSDIPSLNTAAAKKAISDTLHRRGTPGTVENVPGLQDGFNIKYEIQSYDQVSIIIPTKDHAKLLRTAIDSILNKTSYPDYEIIVLNNNSTSKEFFDLMKEYRGKYPGKFKCIDANFPFNFSKLMNLGVDESRGKYILLFNNDLEVIHDDWMTLMVSYAQHKTTGAVGVRLLYPDNTIQHAGIVLGINGDAGHVFVNMPAGTDGYFGCVKTTTNYTAVTGACLMCRKELYMEAGGMDETLEVEYNDIDLCIKFIERGYYNVYLPSVTLYHYESATRGHPFRSKDAWEQHNNDLGIFKSKWQKYIDDDPFYNPNLSRDATDFRISTFKR